MMSANFNLVDEPWITVTTKDGNVQDVSLREAFSRAGDIRHLVGELPTQGFAILRLLLAVLHRASRGPQDVDQWAHMKEHWPDVVTWVDTYLTHFHDRFDLRHPSKPFFQVADLRTATGGVSGLEKLIADIPNGAPFLTTRLGRGVERITWAEAARWLVHVQAFDPSGIRSGAVDDPRVSKGKGYPIGRAWCGQIGGVYVAGDTLAETLLLNLVVADVIEVETGDADRPPWERAPLNQCVDDSNWGEPRGIVDMYTWQARRVRLVGDDAAVVGLVLAQGDPLTSQNRMRFDPLTSWQHRAAGYTPREHDPKRALWRGLDGIVSQIEETSPGSGAKRFLQPAVLHWVTRLRGEGLVSQQLLRLRAVGFKYGGKMATFEELVDDDVVVPVDLLVDASLGQAAIDAVDSAERAVGELARFARNLALAAGASEQADGYRDRARAAAYGALDGPFRRWVAGLDTHADIRAEATSWEERVLEIVRTLGRNEVERAATVAWVGRVVSGRHIDIGRAEVWFRAGLAKVLPLAQPPRAGAPEMEKSA